MTKQEQIEYLHRDLSEGSPIVRNMIRKWIKYGYICGGRYLSNIRNFARYERRGVLRRNWKIFKHKTIYRKQ
jgi:hypothetical protein